MKYLVMKNVVSGNNDGVQVSMLRHRTFNTHHQAAEAVKAAGFTLESKKRPNTWYREDIGEQKSDRFVIALTVKRR